MKAVVSERPRLVAASSHSSLVLTGPMVGNKQLSEDTLINTPKIVTIHTNNANCFSVKKMTITIVLI